MPEVAFLGRSPKRSAALLGSLAQSCPGAVRFPRPFKGETHPGRAGRHWYCSPCHTAPAAFGKGRVGIGRGGICLPSPHFKDARAARLEVGAGGEASIEPVGLLAGGWALVNVRRAAPSLRTRHDHPVRSVRRRDKGMLRRPPSGAPGRARRARDSNPRLPAAA